MDTYEVSAMRRDNIAYIYVTWQNGYIEEAGHILLGWDGQCKADSVFIDEIIAAYKKRLRKMGV